MTYKKNKIIPVILCGGIGSRLWPLSRASFPKQYIPLISESNLSLLQQTALRVSKLENIDKPIFICSEEHRFLVAEQMREINITPGSIILEPETRSTCPAITVGALKALEIDRDSTLVVLSSDHLIKEEKKFLKALEDSFRTASLGNLVTFGIIPNSPETGYGYIKAGKKLFDFNFDSYKIDNFLEKPNLDLAKKLIKDKSYTWNSGMFVFKTDRLLDEIKKYEPNILKSCQSSLEMGFKDLDFQRLDKNSFSSCKEISFDVSIMEKTKNGVVIPLDAKWSDIGSWKSLWENEKKDSNGNVLLGKVHAKDVKNSYIKTENKLIVANNLENLIVVETNDAILLSDKNHSENIKGIVNKLLLKGFPEASEHRKIYRPWGNYLSIAEDLKWKVKKIVVKPGRQLSMQKHFHRSEHWVVVKGKAKVTLNDKVSYLEDNQSIYIPSGSIHRLTNPCESPLVLIEVQSGNYLGEDDIVRFEDDYGRN